MIQQLEQGKAAAVFVKDLSRLGRNYIEVGKLTEEFFPQHDIRLVAVSDGVDSDEGEDDFTPFRNIMNNLYYISTVFINGANNKTVCNNLATRAAVADGFVFCV